VHRIVRKDEKGLTYAFDNGEEGGTMVIMLMKRGGGGA